MFDPVSEIKSRMSIEELVAQYVPLKKVGRNFRGLCPFHDEKSPSFYVSVEKQMAYCFGCRKGGDIFNFIQEIEGFEFKDALGFLAEKIGITLPERTHNSGTSTPHAAPSEKKRVLEIHKAATDFFCTQLLKSQSVLDYVKNRGIKEETITEARLGFAPDSADQLYQFLLKAGFTRAEILASGLAIARDTDSSSCVDRFKDRLIFPILNANGDVCAFGGRALKKDQQPKYLNSPETLIYHKSSVVYYLPGFRDAVRAAGSVIIVEGYMDALAVWQAGYKNVAACSGTAFTEEHIKFLKRFTTTMQCAFDHDQPGIDATDRALSIMIPQELTVQNIFWTGEAKDPDSCLVQSPEAFHNAVKNPESAIVYISRRLKTLETNDGLESTKAMLSFVLPILLTIQSPVILDEWIRNLSPVLNTQPSVLYDELKRKKGGQNSSRNFRRPSKMAATSPSNTVDKEMNTQEYVLGLVLTYPETYSVIKDILSPNLFTDRELEHIYTAIVNQYNQGSLDLDEGLRRRADLLTLLVESTHSEMDWDTVCEEVSQAAASLKRYRFDRDKRNLLNKIRSASDSERSVLLEQYQSLIEEK